MATIFEALRDTATAEDFICAVADLGDPDTGSIDHWDDTDMRHTMWAIIDRARQFQGQIDTSQSILIDGLSQALEGLKIPDKRADALAAVQQALRDG